MFRLSPLRCSSRYTPIVGCAFLVETLYGSKYSANLGNYSMPYVYVKTILLCATGQGLEQREGRYIHGLIELLLPSKISQDNLTKLELLQFVDAIPMDQNAEGQDAMAEDEETEAEAAATLALASAGDGMARGENTRDDSHHHSNSNSDSIYSDGGTAGASSALAAAAARRRQREREEEDDAAAVESIMSFVSPTTFPSSMARVLIYDAVCTCVADGLYSLKEKERVALVSTHIGLSTAVRSQIEKLALQEKVLSIRKRRLLLLHRPHQHRGSAAAAGQAARHRHVLDATGQHQGQLGQVGDAHAASVRPYAPTRGRESEEELKEAAMAERVEAAKKLLRSASRHRQRQKFFAAHH